ncbi:CCR4-NOT core subunit CDC36 [Spizellomyces punctatus DAOM BR117]|uniref:NOT2/NOT3/NOT5 C-terminal domain-containing protein n=1 Tax=Spizellomyces punctatus (strain DAOM BR117) TaxID=645134 RepID=A0A0L0HLN2_SPIPD|nr:CCR4-NOT core subunit CDC36 [Spizellomyces punctatus DAOM BR117]KND02341.1 hypothetical protein SPPG_02812 [Spizellomyces punctatus DAOM BR117]|eukprot:XP_016610380.1 hypothetical protein SPPG_02812 [Spizellomyces punctatus DAOM BR117]
MADFPALGNSSIRDGANGPSLLSFSTIAGGRGPAGPDGLRSGNGTNPQSADFTIDDFPALTPTASANQPHHPQILNRTGSIPGAGRDMSASNGIAPNGGMGMAMGPVTGFGPSSVIGMPANAGVTPRVPPPPGTAPIKRPIGAGSNYASKAQQPQGGEIVGTRASTPADPPASGSTPIPPAGTTDKYGLYGLIDVIRMTDPDMNMLSLGCDLTGLGLNLNSNDALYSTFMSPFSEHPTLGSEPQFALPPCYNLLQSPPPSMTKIGSFSDETLFYIFYAMPRESLQEASAQELYNRNWRFHKELKLWLSKDATLETVKGAGFERGIFVFFDPTSWMRVKKEWIVYYDQLEERGPLAGDIRVARPGGVNLVTSGGPPPGVALEFGSLGPAGFSGDRATGGGSIDPNTASGATTAALPGWPNTSMQQQQSAANFFGGLASSSQGSTLQVDQGGGPLGSNSGNGGVQGSTPGVIVAAGR